MAMAEPLTAHIIPKRQSDKVKVTLACKRDLVERAKKQGINMSYALEQLLEQMTATETSSHTHKKHN